MELRPEMFTGQPLVVTVTPVVPDPHRVDVYLLPGEAIHLLLRIRAFRRRARRDERLAFWAFEDRDDRIGGERRARNVVLQVRREGLAWRFEAVSDEEPKTIETRVLRQDHLLAALLETAQRDTFRPEFRTLARDHPKYALEIVEEWLDLDLPGDKDAAGIIPLEAEDFVPILGAEDSEIRERAMAALGQLGPEREDDVRSDAT